MLAVSLLHLDEMTPDDEADFDRFQSSGPARKAMIMSAESETPRLFAGGSSNGVGSRRGP